MGAIWRQEQGKDPASVVVMAVAEGHSIQTVKALSHGPDVGQKGGDAPVSYSIRKPSVSISRLSPCSAEKRSVGDSFSIMVVI